MWRLSRGVSGHNTGRKDILGIKMAKQGNSGQKGIRGTFLALSFLEDLSRVESREGLPRIVSDFYEL